MRSIYLLLVLFICAGSFSPSLKAQNYKHSRYWVELKDKKGTDFSLDDAHTFLSEKAILRRVKAGIAIDSTDLPVSSIYIDSLKVEGLSVLGTSKWLNAILVEIIDSNKLQLIKSKSFVKNTVPVFGIRVEEIPQPIAMKTNKAMVFANTEYGIADAQMELVNGKYLHEKHYRGEGKTIAVLDAGFSNVPNIAGFSKLYAEQRLSSGYNETENSEAIYQKSAHGTSVLSIMGGEITGEFLGAAPDANYVLFLTENTDYELPIEESYWVFAAEKADSLGADILNSSLGYSTFQDTDLNYTYADMDGKSTIISRAASMLSSKGILLVTSAGNEGNLPWYHITAPADADAVLTVGAVNSEGELAPFSSRGPSSDGRIKPDVVGVGWNTALLNADGAIQYGNGTSFSSPHIAGMAACLWQAVPQLNSTELLNIIRQSADRFENPDNDYGYGIPDFGKAYLLGLDKKGNENVKALELNIFPNPISDHINLLLKVEEAEIAKVQLFDMSGKILFASDWQLNAGGYSELQIRDIAGLSRGVYFIRVERQDAWEVQRLVKF